MKFSVNWLKQWVDPKISIDELSAKLTLAGLEVDSVSPAAIPLEHIVVGQIKSVEPHPDADRLRVCQVDIGKIKDKNKAKDNTLTVVTNAANVEIGNHYPVALEGAEVEGIKIKPTELRGVASFGMFCSTKTLGMTDESEGLFLLPADAPTGQLLLEYLQLDDEIFELEITPNRGDCLCISGIAREVGVLTSQKVTPVDVPEITATHKEEFPVKITDKKECPRYVGRVIKNVDLTKATPLWMQETLRRSGIRSINAAVDITNYVMLELGQPMHAFDMAELHNGIEVRRPKKGEELVLLDGNSVDLEESLLIADSNGPLAIAGVMGGEHSGVSDKTTSLFLESAYFEPVQVTQSARRYGLQTDSSYRFERGVDTQLQARAIERATKLIIDIIGGEPGPVTVVEVAKYIPQPAHIELRRQRMLAIIGCEIPDETVSNILQGLDFTIESSKVGWKVTVPSHRHDVTTEIDLIEEVARIYGYDSIPDIAPIVPMQTHLAKERQLSSRDIQKLLIDNGYHEVVCYSFIDSKVQQLFDPGIKPLPLLNPISSDMDVMRTNLWPNLVQVMQHNQNRQIYDMKLFEIGLRFIPDAKQALQQQAVVSGLICGARHPAQWSENSRPCDFYDLKGDIETLLNMPKREVTFRFESGQHPALHPGQQAEIKVDGNAVGCLGAVHPDIAAKLKLRGPVFVFEILINSLTRAQLPRMQAISKYPAVNRDLAFVLDKNVPAQQIRDIIQTNGGELLNNLQIFDVYQGEGIEAGQKSIALNLIFQHSSRTLIEEEVNSLTESIVNELSSQVGAKLRDW